MTEMPPEVPPGQEELDFGELCDLGRHLDSYCIPCGGPCQMWEGEDCD